MEGYIKPIGGEFWFDNAILNKNIDNFNETNSILLNGGQSAIEFILQDIDLKESEYILMPSYLCPTILYKFEKKNISMLFYEINEDLSINIEDVKELIKKFNVKVLYFINYFGFYHNEETITYFKDIKEKGIILIEDAVQMLWFKKLNKFIGNYVFNSYRKFFPYDGSMVICDSKTNSNFKIKKDKYYKLVLEARIKKTQYINKHIGEEENFLNKFIETEKWYYKRNTINGIDEISKQNLSHIDFHKLKKERIDNYNFIYGKLKECNKVKVLFNTNQIEDNAPLAFPILINDRDFIRKELRKYNIYCPVHWDVTEERWILDFPKSISISKSILSIPIDWRYNLKDMNRITDTIFNLYRFVK